MLLYDLESWLHLATISGSIVGFVPAGKALALLALGSIWLLASLLLVSSPTLAAP